jgi:hypothetical protein
MHRDDLATVGALMRAFAIDSGITGTAAPRRYLWTDAHAVCTFLRLADLTADPAWHELALALVSQVHTVLGRHRTDDHRQGWISGLPEEEGLLHPTAGGLRIGKPEPERGEREGFDERREWDRDGQYYHYLTRWMHALSTLGSHDAQTRYIDWAAELSRAACRGFLVHRPVPHLCWKMSIDLSRPLVASAGHHDPLDGLITTLSIAQARGRVGELQAVIDTLVPLCRDRQWATDDALGLGGLLFDAARVSRLSGGPVEPYAQPLMLPVLDAVAAGLPAYARSGALRLPATHRLAFRELGLAIGLGLVEQLRHADLPSEARRRIAALAPYQRLADDILAFWLEPAHRQVASWTEHADINTVTLATGLVPDGLLPPV